MAASLHEAREELPPRTMEMHRALLSLIEELEAVDWYAQRVAASRDDALKQVLSHSLEEEKEHACMTLEWIRRNDPGFHNSLRRFLFRDDEEIVHPEDGAPARARLDESLGIGSLRAEQA
ncbi:MAG TPA: ferritin [Myxococcota bacterium]|nr:ferritin [Myxococcota bacterium]